MLLDREPSLGNIKLMLSDISLACLACSAAVHSAPCGVNKGLNYPKCTLTSFTKQNRSVETQQEQTSTRCFFAHVIVFLSPHLCLPHKLRPTWTLTHTVSLYPEGASAAQWALKVKTEQIKVTVGGAQPATGHTICCVCLCACVCKYFYLSNRGTSPERAPVKWLLSYMLTLIAPLRLRSTALFLPSSCLRKTTALISSCAC